MKGLGANERERGAAKGSLRMGSSKGARCELVSGVDDPGERRALTWLLGSAAVFARGAEEGELVAEVVGACARAAGYARVLLRRSGSEPPEAAPVAPSRLELPVDDQGEALGTLVIELDEPGGFAERERALLAALAEDFGAALGVARRRSVESARRGTE